MKTILRLLTIAGLALGTATTGAPAVVGTLKFDRDMTIPGKVMHSGSKITPTGEPGQYRAKNQIGHGGRQATQLHYDGPRGRGQVSFTVHVKL